MNPHFLFNTLNNIYSLIQLDTTRAQQAVHDLSRMLRYVLYDSSRATVPLAAEIDFLRDYIELMRIRLPRHVRLFVSLPDAPSSTPIAPLLFISLVENAFKHGVSNEKPSYITIDIHELEGQLICSIKNSRFPKSDSDRSGSGIGLEQSDQAARHDIPRPLHPRIRPRRRDRLPGAALHQIRRTMRLTCAIIDDEPLAVELMESYVRKTPFLELKASFGSGVAACEALREAPVDLLFCDIQMPGLNGMELLAHAARGDPRDFHHGLHPVCRRGVPRAGPRLPAQAHQLRRLSGGGRQGARLVRDEAARRGASPAGKEPQSIFLRTEYRLQQIELERITYIEGLKDYVKIHVDNQPGPILSLMNLKALEEQLPPDRFVRIHRSYIIQPSKMQAIERNRVVIGKEYLPVSESYRQTFYTFLVAHSLLF